MERVKAWRPPHRVRGWSLKAVAKRLLYRLYEVEAWLFDKIYAVDTAGFKDTKDTIRGYNFYAPVFAPIMVLALASIRGRCRRWRTVDIGGGKGKVAMLAWLLGFRNLGYVEMDEGLAAIAVENFRKRGMQIDTVCGDALAQDYPDPICLLLFNPFQQETTLRFLDGLSAHRNVVIIYINPPPRALFESRGFRTRAYGAWTLCERLAPVTA